VSGAGTAPHSWLTRGRYPTAKVAEYSRPEAAKRAGVEPAYLDRLIELGIIAPGAGDRLNKGDVRRTQNARTLETAMPVTARLPDNAPSL
jgi:hypothetical protein